MCYNYSLKAAKAELEQRYAAEFIEETEPYFDITANGFTHLKMPVITNTAPDKIQFFNWGLIPFFAKDEATAKQLSKMCLNAMMETIHEKPSFRDAAKHKRCLIPFTTFYEWQWSDLTKKNCTKQKYEIGLSAHLSSFAGLWSSWTNKANGEIVETFTIITTAANEVMAKIHNHKKRMPLILLPEQEIEWLNGNALDIEMNLPLETNRVD